MRGRGQFWLVSDQFGTRGRTQLCVGPVTVMLLVQLAPALVCHVKKRQEGEESFPPLPARGGGLFSPRSDPKPH